MPREDRPAPPPEDLAQVYDRLGARLFRYAKILLDDDGEAEDVVHEVFVEMIQGGDVLPQVIDGYLFRSVRNRCMNVLKRRGRHATFAAQLLEPRQGMEDKLNERLALEGALRSLPVGQREVVHLKVFGELNFREIAAMTGDPINTVMSRYRYALERMQDYLDKG
jgi:RNA polymerase sigma-70 factor (ECF subfamily)